jgi:hypothetical protein
MKGETFVSLNIYYGQIQDCCDMIDKIPDATAKAKLIDILRSVTAGKVHLITQKI